MSIDVTYGPMFAGKSTSLIEKIEKLEIAGKKCLIIKHSKDTRSDGVIESHDGKKHTAMTTLYLMNLFNMDGIIAESEYIVIDEGQFFEDLFEFCVKVKKLNKHVIVAGLDLKFNKEPFGEIPKLLGIADVKQHLFAECECGKQAPFSHLNKSLVSNLNDKIIIGGSDKYMAVCSECYNTLNCVN